MKYAMLLGGFVLATIAITEASTTDIERAVLRITELDGGPLHTIELAPDYLDNAIVAIQQVGEHETMTSGFTLSEPMNLRVISVGEGVGWEMLDYGWIVDATNHRTVWTMDYSDTYRAGGGSKNRISDEVIHLPAGSYLANYTTDVGHSFGNWNTAAPDNPELWGITVLPVDGNVEATSSYDPRDNVISRIVRVGDGQTRRQTFSLDESTTISVYSLGEGSGGEMDDYASIQRADDHSSVWTMTYGDTEWAGGAQKNRMATESLTLPAGDYLLRYESDGSHSYGDWNSEAPHDAANWGVTVSTR
jgi:hypothetical protein